MDEFYNNNRKNYIKRGKNYYDYSEDTIQELGPASKSGISISS